MNQELHMLVHDQFTLLGKFIMHRYPSDSIHELCKWRIDVDTIIPRYPAAYAFSLDGEIVYVGSAVHGLRNRFRHYCRGPHTARHKIFNQIYDVVISGKELNILFSAPKETTWNELPICQIAGLEYALTRELQPKWNQHNKVNNSHYQRMKEIDIKRGVWQ